MYLGEGSLRAVWELHLLLLRGLEDSGVLVGRLRGGDDRACIVAVDVTLLDVPGRLEEEQHPVPVAPVCVHGDVLELVGQQDGGGSLLPEGWEERIVYKHHGVA